MQEPSSRQERSRRGKTPIVLLRVVLALLALVFYSLFTLVAIVFTVMIYLIHLAASIIQAPDVTSRDALCLSMILGTNFQ